MPDDVVVDPTGLVVVLHEATWSRHVLLRHPSMRDLRTEVVGAIHSPTYVRESRIDTECRLFMAPSRLRSGWWITVVVDVAGTHEPFVKTAYLAKAPKAGVQLWP